MWFFPLYFYSKREINGTINVVHTEISARDEEDCRILLNLGHFVLKVYTVVWLHQVPYLLNSSAFPFPFAYTDKQHTLA
jgi:hypothetical protein